MRLPKIENPLWLLDGARVREQVAGSGGRGLCVRAGSQTCASPGSSVTKLASVTKDEPPQATAAVKPSSHGCTGAPQRPDRPRRTDRRRPLKKKGTPSGHKAQASFQAGARAPRARPTPGLPRWRPPAAARRGDEARARRRGLDAPEHLAAEAPAAHRPQIERRAGPQSA